MSKKKSAIIAGIAGQDGSYLAKLLIEKRYKVLGFLKKGDDVSVLSHLMKEIVLMEMLKLGNIEARRDWGFAGDYVKAIWMMLQADTPDDYIVATGESHSIKDFLQAAFQHVGLDWEKWVEVDPALIRAVDVGRLVGDYAKAREKLGWKPEVA